MQNVKPTTEDNSAFTAATKDYHNYLELILSQPQTPLLFLGTGAAAAHLGKLEYIFFSCEVVSCFKGPLENVKSLTSSLEKAVKTTACLLITAVN